MRKLVVLMLVLGMASLASATPWIQFGDASGAFGAGDKQITITPGTDYVLSVWAFSDIAQTTNPDTGNINTDSGVDNAQIFAQFDSTKLGLKAGSLTNFAGVSGNPMGTASISGKSTGTYNGLQYILGALVPSDPADAFAASRIMSITLTVAQVGQLSKISMLSPGGNNETFIGNSVVGSKNFGTSSVTFVPEPATLAILGLGGLLLRKRK